EGAERLFYNPETKDELLDRLPDDIAFVCYFRNLIINALQRTIDEKRFKKIHRALEDRYSYTLMKRYYNNFCTQWVDIQNVKYLKRAPEKRKTYPKLFTPLPGNRLNTRKTLIKMKNKLSPKR
ncbi:hypothetical protein SAMN02910436_02954, partial [Ruminococcaceae bacterium P7]